MQTLLACGCLQGFLHRVKYKMRLSCSWVVVALVSCLWKTGLFAVSLNRLLSSVLRAIFEPVKF
jgi:hypothetical protein